MSPITVIIRVPGGKRRIRKGATGWSRWPHADNSRDWGFSLVAGNRLSEAYSIAAFSILPDKELLESNSTDVLTSFGERSIAWADIRHGGHKKTRKLLYAHTSFLLRFSLPFVRSRGSSSSWAAQTNWSRLLHHLPHRHFGQCGRWECSREVKWAFTRRDGLLPFCVGSQVSLGPHRIQSCQSGLRQSHLLRGRGRVEYSESGRNGRRGNENERAHVLCEPFAVGTLSQWARPLMITDKWFLKSKC